MEDKNTMHLIG